MRGNGSRVMHGQSKTRLYGIWSGMMDRCFNEKSEAYRHYGGRGITVHSSMQHFEGFRSVVGSRPGGMTIERIDNDGNYAPGNVRWATRKEQCRNTRVNHLVTYRGETRTLAEWAEILGIAQATLGYRLRDGWDVEKAFNTAVKEARPHRMLTAEETASIRVSVETARALAAKYGVHSSTINRIRKGPVSERGKKRYAGIPMSPRDAVSGRYMSSKI